MEYLPLILILAAAFIPALILLLRTNQSKKRGCGRGCATCGNREFCHRRNLNLSKFTPARK